MAKKHRSFDDLVQYLSCSKKWKRKIHRKGGIIR